jgi:hypothetical protein
MASIYQTLANVFSDIRYIAGKDSTTLPDSDLLRMSNKYFLWLLRENSDINENLYGQISFTDLVVDQREYPLPVDDETGGTSHPYGGGALNIMRVEISYDAGTTWRVAKVISFLDIKGPMTLDADLNDQYTRTNPVYWFYDRSIFIAPVPGSTDTTTSGNAGLRIWYVQRSPEADVTTDILNLPKDFLGILAEGVLIDVFRKYGRMNDMRISESRFNKMIDDMKSFETGIDYEEAPRLGVSRKDYR